MREKRRKISLAVAVFLLVTLLLFVVSCNKEPASSGNATSTHDTDTPTAAPGTGEGDPTDTSDNTGGEMEKLYLSDMRINMTDVPLGIDSTPVFAWTVGGGQNENSQSAYRIAVSSDKEKALAGEADIWDSGKVESDDSTSVPYGGDALSSCSTYYWTVTVWDAYGESAMSSPVEFRTGIFEGDEWKGSWIGSDNDSIQYALSGAKWIWLSGRNNGATADGSLSADSTYFRYSFTPKAGKTLKSVNFVFTADDYGVLYANGQTVLSIQNTTDVWKTGNVADITEVMTSGENVIALRVYNATVGYAGLVGRLYVAYTDGTLDIYATDMGSWKVSKSAQDGWNDTGFDDSSWKSPDQYVTYGQSPWGTNVVISNEGDRAAVLLRKEFETKSGITEATVYMSGIGYSILSINGKLADDCFLDPCNTQYSQTVLYRTFDVTGLLKSGAENAVAVELGNGFYNEEGGVWNWGSAEWKDDPKLLFWMIIRYEDGSTQEIVSDTTWKGSVEGPTTFNSIYYGEFYDARLEKDGWDNVGYDDSSWSDAVAVKAPEGKLECQLEDPVRRTESFKPSEIKKLSDGSYVVYCPEMVAGWIALTIDGAKSGDTITITYSEKLNSDGSVQKLGGSDGVNSGWWPETYIMTDKYISAGDESVIFEPKFSYKGFRYIQIWGYPGELTEDDIVIYRIRNDIDVTGSFESSNTLINQLHQLMVTTSLNNLQGKPTDTPVWEKNGWLGDFNVALTTMCYNFEMAGMSENFIEIMETCFNEYGLLPQMVPTAGWGVADHYVWNSVYILGVAEMYDMYGSVDYIKEQYTTMSKFADYVMRRIRANRWVCPDGQLGDWVSPMGNNPNAGYVESPSEGSGIVGTAFVYKMYEELARMAELIGQNDDAIQYRTYMSSIYDAFNAKFYNEEKGIYETTVWTQYGTRTRYRQTSNIMPLAFNMVPDEYRETVIKNLIADIESKDNHLDTGCVGTKFILPVLTDLGYGELAYTITNQTTYPSWGFMVAQGSTSLWEMWETTSRSLGHYFLGTYDEWFYSHLAGVTDITNGYETFTIRPYVLGDLTYINCTLDTVRGTLESSWTKAEDGSVTMNVTVPFGSTAKIVVPVDSPSSVTVNGEAVEDIDNISLGSGTYVIVCNK